MRKFYEVLRAVLVIAALTIMVAMKVHSQFPAADRSGQFKYGLLMLPVVLAFAVIYLDLRRRGHGRRGPKAEDIAMCSEPGCAAVATDGARCEAHRRTPSKERAPLGRGSRTSAAEGDRP